MKKGILILLSIAMTLIFPVHAQSEENKDIKTVYVVFKTHLDVGFTDSQFGCRVQLHPRFYSQATGCCRTVKKRRQGRALCVDHWFMADMEILTDSLTAGSEKTGKGYL